MLQESIEEALKMLQRQLDVENVRVLVLSKEELLILGAANELIQVVVNLVKNSIDAFVQNGVLLREIMIEAKKEGAFAILQVTDNAGGIHQKEYYKVFEPYFTTKHKSRGTGLGLFIAKMVCETGFGGSIDLHSQKNMTTFTIKIPFYEKK